MIVRRWCQMALHITQVRVACLCSFSLCVRTEGEHTSSFYFKCWECTSSSAHSSSNVYSPHWTAASLLTPAGFTPGYSKTGTHSSSSYGRPPRGTDTVGRSHRLQKKTLDTVEHTSIGEFCVSKAVRSLRQVTSNHAHRRQKQTMPAQHALVQRTLATHHETTNEEVEQRQPRSQGTGP